MALPRQEELTPVQRQLVLYILKYLEDHCYQPTYQEMSAYMGVNPRAVHDCLGQLERKGILRLPPARTERAIEFPWAKVTVSTDEERNEQNARDATLA